MMPIKSIINNKIRPEKSKGDQHLLGLASIFLK